jgi:rod shape-determining protein MreD
MFARRFFISFPIFAFIYILQESVVSQFKIFGGGFSLFLIFALLWSALGTPEMGALTGFGAGLMMDLSQSTSGPMGQWTLIMILAGFTISYLGYGDDNFRGNPISLIFTIAAGVVIIRLIYLVLGLLLGSDVGSTWSVIISLFSSAFWSAVLSPLLLPAVTRVHEALFDVKSGK